MHHEQPIWVETVVMASHRRVGSSFFQPSCTAVSRLPIATSTPEWCDAAAVGSTIRPKRRWCTERAIRGTTPFGSSATGHGPWRPTSPSVRWTRYPIRRDRRLTCDMTAGHARGAGGPTHPERSADETSADAARRLDRRAAVDDECLAGHPRRGV